MNESVLFFIVLIITCLAFAAIAFWIEFKNIRPRWRDEPRWNEKSRNE